VISGCRVPATPVTHSHDPAPGVGMDLSSETTRTASKAVTLGRCGPGEFGSKPVSGAGRTVVSCLLQQA